VLLTSTLKLLATPLIINARPKTRPVAKTAKRKRRDRHWRSLTLASHIGPRAPVQGCPCAPCPRTSERLIWDSVGTNLTAPKGPSLRQRRPCSVERPMGVAKVVTPRSVHVVAPLPRGEPGLQPVAERTEIA
jgi:hypothetical protein